MQERYTPLSREAGTATHCLLSFSSVTFMSTVEALLLMLGSPLMMGAGKVVEQQLGALGNPCSSFSSPSSLLCIRRGFDKNFTPGNAIHSPDRASVRITASPAASLSCYSLQSTSSLSRRMQRGLKLVHIRVNRSYGSSCTGTGIHSGLSLPMIISTGPAA